MIDIENDVINLVTETVHAEWTTAFVGGEYTEYPSSFPAVTVEEIDNRVYQRMRTENIENAVTVTYQINVFSNKAGQRKSEAKSIMNAIDAVLTAKGFTRIMTEHVPNLNDSKIFRYVARYEAVVGPHGSNHFLIYQN